MPTPAKPRKPRTPRTPSTARYRTCPGCDANFKLEPGEKFPPHRGYRGLPCPAESVEK